jgi:DNA primase
MNRKNVKAFLRTITGEELVDQDKWVMTKCPLAPYTHTQGTDNKPSFGISVSGDKESVYYCFTCSEKARNLVWLMQNIWLMFGEYPEDAALVYIGGKAKEDRFAVPGYRDKWVKPKEIKAEPIPKDIINLFPSVYLDNSYSSYKVKSYLFGRGINLNTIHHFGIRYCEERKSMIFPYTLADGEIYQLQQRTVGTKVIFFTTPKMVQRTDLSFFTIKESGSWFGLDKANPKKSVVVVEGAIDAMKLHTLGIKNVIASFNANVAPKQFTMLTFPRIFLGFDMDKPGMKARRQVLRELKDKVPLIDLDWRWAKRKENGVEKSCEDPGEIPNKEELLKVTKKSDVVY